MAKISRLSGSERESLAAYLDGELDEAATHQIEQILAVSEVARHEVDMLSRTWDLLNVLETPRASEEFSQKTLLAIRAAEQPGSQLASLFYHNVRRGVVLAAFVALLAVAGFAGYQGTNRWFPNEADMLLDDFELIDNFDKYSEVGSLEFLKTMRDNQTFADFSDSDAK